MDKKIDNEEKEKKEAAPLIEGVAEQGETVTAESSSKLKEDNAVAQIQQEKQKISGEDPGSQAQSDDDDDDLKKDLQSENRLAALMKLVELKKISVPDAIKQAEQAGADVLDRFHDLLIEKGLAKDVKP